MTEREQVYRKILDTYAKEMRPLLTTLPVYLEEDIELFQIKAHGLKGASRQIGKQEIGDFAEHMEIAAKEGDMRYIRENFDYFLQELESVLRQVAEERDAIPVIKKNKSKVCYSAQELFLELKKGFDSYNLKQIEDVLALLEESELNEVQTKLLPFLQQACDELEYEKGSELLREMS